MVKTPTSEGGAPSKAFPLDNHTAPPVTGLKRDSVRGQEDTSPAIVSLSDIHGYLESARSALLTLSDRDDYTPIVETDTSGRLHWAGNDYVLLFNGDLIDRGPASTETLQMVARLLDEAPSGAVRVTLGNHEMAVLTPALFRWSNWFCGQVGPEGRHSLIASIQDGHVTAAYEGYNVTYAHAGHGDAYDVGAVNDTLCQAATRLQEASGTAEDAATQRAVVADNPLVLGTGDTHLKQPPAGLIWLDFGYLSGDTPPQVVGHTGHDTVTQQGRVVCENVIRNSEGSPGGEAIMVETPSRLVSLTRRADGSVRRTTYDV